jgi:hypothetical protein
MGCEAGVSPLESYGKFNIIPMKHPSSAQSSGRQSWRLGAIAGLYLGIFLCILFMAYTGNLPAFLQKIPYYDKAGHVILYALAAYLGHRVCRCRWLSLGLVRFPLFPTLFGLFTLTEELLQQLSPHRTLDWIDLIASCAGIALGGWLAEREHRQQVVHHPK